LKNHYFERSKYLSVLLKIQWIFVILLSLLVIRKVRDTCSFAEMPKGYMTRESSGTPALADHRALYTCPILSQQSFNCCADRCEYELTNKSGLITSPNYPQPYPSSYHCKWKITVPVGLRIALWFRDFALESGIILRGTCPYDYLDVVVSASTKPSKP